MAPPTHPLRRSTDPLDLELDLRDAAEAVGVVDLTARMRPAGGRRSSRQTHTRLVAALARIQESSLAANGQGADRTALDLPGTRHAPLGCGTQR